MEAVYIKYLRSHGIAVTVGALPKDAKSFTTITVGNVLQEIVDLLKKEGIKHIVNPKFICNQTNSGQQMQMTAYFPHNNN